MRSTTLDVDGHQLVIVAFDRQNDPSIGPVVAEGRLPAVDDEIALGSEAMKILGVGIGDSFVPPPNEGAGQGAGEGSSAEPLWVRSRSLGAWSSMTTGLTSATVAQEG